MNKPGIGPSSLDSGLGVYPDLAAVAVVTVVFRVLHLNAPPHFDEMYHVLAAQGWLDTGTFSIGNGEYTRVPVFTLIVAAAFSLFGESLVVARIPSVLFGSLWVFAVFFWTRRQAGRTVALVAALFLAVYPNMVQLSQFSRFYALHGLVFWLGAAGVYYLTHPTNLLSRSSDGLLPPNPRFLVVLVATLGALAFCYSLQSVTVIGGIALGVWCALTLGAEALGRGSRAIRARWVLGILGLVGTAVLSWLIASGEASQLWRRYQTAALWAASEADDPFWYYREFRSQFGVFWLAFPIAAVAAIRWFGRPAAFATVIFVVAFLLHSGADQKHERYLAYAVPYLVLIGSMAAVPVLEALWRKMHLVLLGITPPRIARVAATTGLIATTAALGYAAPVNYPIRRWVVPDEGWRPNGEPDWAAATPALRPLVDESDVLVVAGLPKALYYLDRGEIGLSASELSELTPYSIESPEFMIDPRTGRPFISRPESMLRLMQEHSSGLVLVDGHQWDNDCCVSPEMSAFLSERLSPVVLDPAWQLRAFRW